MQQAEPLITSLRQPKIELLEIKEDFIKFILSDTDISVANALRRVMIGETPTMAIDLVTIEKNSSVLHDEYFAHRLGMVPIRVNTEEGVKDYKYKHDCFCEGDFCPTCSIELSLDVTNEGEEDVKLVTSDDLKPLGAAANTVEPVLYSSTEEYSYTTDSLHIKKPGITLVKLAKGQSIKCHCIALKGISKIHAKWCPVSVATFAYDPIIELNDTMLDELTAKQQEEFIQSCPTKVFKEINGKISVDKREACMFCDECVALSERWKENAESEPLVVIKTEPNRFIFSVETTGALKPDEVVFNALSILQEKLQLIHRKIDDIQKSGGNEVILPASQAGFVDTGGFI